MNDLQVSSSWKDKTEEWSQVREDQGEKNHVQQGTFKDTHSCAPSMKKKKRKTMAKPGKKICTLIMNKYQCWSSFLDICTVVIQNTDFRE